MIRFPVAAFASAMVFAAVAEPTLAADLPAPALPPPQAPAVYMPAPPPFSWTGFYVGGNAGYGWANSSGGMIGGTLGGVSFAGPFSASGNGFLGGAQVGYNFQYGAGVFGVETDFQGTVGSGTVSAVTDAVNATAKNPWFGTVRGRVGYAFDRILVYATGGGVYGNSTLSGTAGVGPAAFSSSTTYWAWTVGLGVEAALGGPWSAKIEYLYVGTPSSVPAVPNVTAVAGTANTNIIRGGINYHF